MGRRGACPAPEIVTAQHSDYTGPEKVASEEGITAQSRERGFILSWMFPHALYYRMSQGAPPSMTARIFKPAKNAMQSGRAKTREWQLDYEPEQPRAIEPLMG